MVTIYCANCEAACSDKAERCPKCGHPLIGKAGSEGAKRTRRFLSRKSRTIIAICNVVAILLGTVLYWAYRSGVNARPITGGFSQVVDLQYRDVMRRASVLTDDYHPTLQELDRGMRILREVHARGRVDAQRGALVIGAFMGGDKWENLDAQGVELYVNTVANVYLQMKKEGLLEGGP